MGLINLMHGRFENEMYKKCVGDVLISFVKNI
jgi:hypothetical protein